MALSEPPSATSLCEIAKNPEDYDGKRIRLRGVAKRGFEISWLLDESCTPNVRAWLTFGEDRTSSHILEVALLKSSADLFDPKKLLWKPYPAGLPVALVKDGNFERINAVLKDDCNSFQLPRCDPSLSRSVVGTFTGRIDYSPHGPKAFRDKKGQIVGTGKGGFGHLNFCEFRFVLESVVEFEVTTTKVR